MFHRLLAEFVRFSRRVAPNRSDATPSAASPAQTFAANSSPPTRGVAANLRIGRATASAERQHARSRMALTGRVRLPPETTGDYLVWT